MFFVPAPAIQLVSMHYTFTIQTVPAKSICAQACHIMIANLAMHMVSQSDLEGNEIGKQFHAGWLAVMQMFAVAKGQKGFPWIIKHGQDQGHFSESDWRSDRIY